MRFCFASDSGEGVSANLHVEADQCPADASHCARLSDRWFRGGTFFAPQIVFVISRKDFNPAFADFKDTGRQLVNEVAVMRDEDHGAGELL